MLRSTNQLIRKIFVFAILLTLFNCDKKTSEVSPADQNQLAPGVTVTEEYIRFESIDAYENFFIDGNESARAKLIQAAESNQAHISMLRVANLRTSSTSIVDSLYPDFLKTILNADGITKIGDFIIKVDMANEKVLVLKNEDIQYYDDLVSNNFTNSKILVYSTNDEVLEMLVNGISPSQSANTSSSNQRTTLFCNKKAAGPKDDKGFETYMNNWRLDCKVVHQNAGIYFSLQAKVNKQKYAIAWIESTDNQTMFLDYNYSYTPKCKGGKASSGSINTGGADLNLRPYESTTGLEKFSYTVTFRTNTGTLQNPSQHVSRVYHINN